MPASGLGTGCQIGGCSWPLPELAQAAAANMTSSFLSLGGRRIDDADSYGLAEGVGTAVAHSGLVREDVFIVSKTGPGGLPYPLGYNETHDQAKQIVANYSLEYVDLILIHWPVNYGPCSYRGPKPSIPTTDPACNTELDSYNERECRLNSWRGLLRAWRAGWTRAIGVSNFNSTHLEEIRAAGLPMPAVNQVQFSPQHGPDTVGCSPYSTETCTQLMETCKRYGIAFNGYSPFGGPGQAGKLLDDPRLVPIAAKHNATVAQVVLSWEWSRHGVLVNPEARNPVYQHDNVFFFVPLAEAELEVLDQWNDH